MFERRKRQKRAQQLFSTAEEAMFFEQAAKEVAATEIQPGLYAKALSHCEGDEVKAAAVYLQLRVEMLKQEAALEECILDAARTDSERSVNTREESFNLMIVAVGAFIGAVGLLAGIFS